MKIRFLTSIVSDSFSFRGGQIVTVPKMPPELKPFVDGVRAEIVTDEPELAVVGESSERAVMPHGRGRG